MPEINRARQVANLGAEYVSVTDFGATGDGATDDTAAIQAALTEGGRIYFPPGNYKVTSTLTGVSDTWITGYGAILTHESSTAEDVLYFVNVTDVSVEGLEVDGRNSLKSTGSSTGRGIHLEGVTRGTVKNCYVHNTWEHGIRLGGSLAQQYDSLYVKCVNNTVVDCGNGTPNFRGYGIWCFWNVEHLIISGNNVRDCYGGIMVDDTSSDATPNLECRYAAITGNTIYQEALALGSTLMRGINIEGCTNIVCTGNMIKGKLVYGILINDGQGEALTDKITVTGNDVDLTDITATAAYGIGIVDSSAVLVEANRVNLKSTSSSSAAIRVSSGNEGTAITAGSFTVGRDYRILSVGTTDFTLIGADSNTVGLVFTATGVGTGTGTASTPSRAEDIAIIGNHILSTRKGIYVEDTTTADIFPDNVSIISNTVLADGDLSGQSSALGIYLIHATNSSIKSNNVQNFYTNIAVSSLCSGCKVFGNEATGASGNYNYSFGSIVKALRNYSTDSNTAGFRIDSGANNASTLFAYNQAEDSLTISGTSSNIVFRLNNFGINTYTPTNVVTDRAYDANSTTTAELADVLGTLISDLQSQGIIT